MKILVPLAEGFEEIEAIVPIDVWRRAEYEVTAAGFTKEAVRASRKTLHVPDATLDEVMERNFDLIFLPGGRPGADHLAQHEPLGARLKKQSAEGKWIAAICAAPIILNKHGLLKDAKFTCHPSVREKLKPPAAGKRVVIDEKNKLITAPGAGAAMELALAAVTLFSGEKKSKQIQQALVHHDI